MAGDLIPPPSPAGRPAPDPAATPVRARADEPPPAPVPEPSAPPGESPFRARFGFLWGVLAGVAVCMLALAGVLATTADDDNGPPLARNWSAWQPSTSRMFDGAKQIAERISRQYQLDSGQPLTLVDSGPPEFKLVPAGIAVLPSGGQVEELDGPALLYGINLVDAEDKSTDRRTRDRLLQREALELALYSFRYLDDVTTVAVVLPTEGKVSRAVLYRPGDLVPELQVPLAKTLAPTPPRPKKLSKADVARIDELVPRHLFESSIRPLDGRKPYFVLAESEIVDGS